MVQYVDVGPSNEKDINRVKSPPHIDDISQHHILPVLSIEVSLR